MNNRPLKSYLLLGAGLTSVGLIAYNPSREKLVSMTKKSKAESSLLTIKNQICQLKRLEIRIQRISRTTKW
ncbi:hypothetical protein ABN702_08430 [Bacillus haimaensis]|uniref:hypothetical protein n=1 Tax=Bacillus haimaensis TaxID=3160967 RepID=UPI003AA9AC9E